MGQRINWCKYVGVAAGSTTRVRGRWSGWCASRCGRRGVERDGAVGQTVANAAVATLGAGGEICVFSSVETNVLVDLNGVFT